MIIFLVLSIELQFIFKFYDSDNFSCIYILLKFIIFLMYILSIIIYKEILFFVSYFVIPILPLNIIL